MQWDACGRSDKEHQQLWLRNARGLLVQIVGDEHGNAVAFNGRDCSTQRRFQKIFEEGPPTIADPAVFKQMERSAQRLTSSIGYIGAGTVEYLYNAATKRCVPNTATLSFSSTCHTNTRVLQHTGPLGMLALQCRKLHLSHLKLRTFFVGVVGRT